MSLLFDEPLIAGLQYRDDVISAAEEQVILDRLMPLELAPFRFHGFIGNRKTHSFGWRYDFDDASFTRTEPIPDWLQSLRERAAGLADVQPSDFVHVLLARYDPGAGIGWHRDRDVFEKVVGMSLNTAATLRFRQRTATASAAPASTLSHDPHTSFPARAAGIGSTASRPATSCASQLRSGHCPTKAGASRTTPDRNGSRAERFLRACAGCGYSRQSWRAAPRARTRTYNESSKRVRSVPNGRSSMNRQARASSRRLTS